MKMYVAGTPTSLAPHQDASNEYIYLSREIRIRILKIRSVACFKCQSSDMKIETKHFICSFVLRFYGPVNPMGSCRARSVYLTTRLLGRLSPLSGSPVLCTFFPQKLTTALLESADGRE